MSPKVRAGAIRRDLRVRWELSVQALQSPCSVVVRVEAEILHNALVRRENIL